MPFAGTGAFIRAFFRAATTQPSTTQENKMLARDHKTAFA